MCGASTPPRAAGSATAGSCASARWTNPTAIPRTCISTPAASSPGSRFRKTRRASRNSTTSGRSGRRAAWPGWSPTGGTAEPRLPFLRNEPTQRRIPQFGGGAARGAAGNEITIHILSPELRSSISAWTVRRSCAANLTTSSIARNAGSCYDEVSLIEQCRDAGL